MLLFFPMANPDITLYFHDFFVVFLFLRKAVEVLFLVVVIIVHLFHCSFVCFIFYWGCLKEWFGGFGLVGLVW